MLHKEIIDVKIEDGGMIVVDKIAYSLSILVAKVGFGEVEETKFAMTLVYSIENFDC